jgi:predicted outer membrane repeat protein
MTQERRSLRLAIGSLVCAVSILWSLPWARAAELLVPSEHATIQDAVDAATDGDEIVLAPGRYRGEGNREISLQGKAITIRSEAGPQVTVLDGEGGWRLFMIDGGEGPDTVIEGLTFVNGYSGVGGAIACVKTSSQPPEPSSPTIRNCVFRNNSATTVGAAIHCDQSSPVIENCRFYSNRISRQDGDGAAINCWQGSPVITGCLFVGNQVTGTESDGGAISVAYSDLEIRDCIFRENYAYANGGGVAVLQSTVLIERCRFVSNESRSGRGGGVSVLSGSLTFRDSWLESNIATWGGALAGFDSQLAVARLYCGENRARDGGAAAHLQFSGGVLTAVRFVDNSLAAGETQGGAAVYIGAFDPMFVDCLFQGNRALTVGGAVAVAEGATPQFQRCVFTENTAGDAGGAIHSSSSSPILHQVRISACSVTNVGARGGAIFLTTEDPRQDFRLRNSLITDCQAQAGGGALYAEKQEYELRNCTLSGNVTASGTGGGLLAGAEGGANLLNVIVHGNLPDALAEDGGTIVARYSDVEGGWPGTGNIDLDPLFVAGAWGAHYLSQVAAGQTEDSPCLDGGNALAEEICFPGPEGDVCLDTVTTRADGVPDADEADMGFHYRLETATPAPTVAATLTPTAEITFTATPTVTPSPTDSPLPTSTPTMTPTPSPSPTVSPTPTGCHYFGVQLEIPREYVCPGQTFYCKALICSEEMALTPAPFIAMLDLGTGEYWFYPSWAHYPPDIDWQHVNLFPAVELPIDVLPEFTWPDTGSSSFEGISIISAILNPQMTEILGDMATVTFGYGPCE